MCTNTDTPIQRILSGWQHFFFSLNLKRKTIFQNFILVWSNYEMWEKLSQLSYNWCFRKTLFWPTPFYSSYLLNYFSVHAEVIYEIIQEINSLYGSGCINLRVDENALKTVIPGPDCEIQKFRSMHSLELCASARKVMWLYHGTVGASGCKWPLPVSLIIPMVMFMEGS